MLRALLSATVAVTLGACQGPPRSVERLLINEVSCRGNDDWIELSASHDVDVSGMQVGIEDGPRYRFPPGSTLRAGSLPVLYRGRELDFAISCNGDSVALWRADGSLLSRVAPPPLYNGQSYGRMPASMVLGVLRATAGESNQVTPMFAEGGDDFPAPGGSGVCVEVSTEWGTLVCADTTVDDDTFAKLAIADPFTAEIASVAKYTVPAQPRAILPAMLQHGGRFPLHQEFLSTVFASTFPGLDSDGYRELVMVRASRRYFTGSAFHFADSGRVGFSVVSDPALSELLTMDEVAGVARAIAELLGREQVTYVPIGNAQIDRALSWQETDFPLRILAAPAGTSEQVYTPGVTYGRVRIMSLAQLADAVAAGALSWQDIVVVDEAPYDLEAVVGGLVTSTPQSALSHLAIRMSRRGTVNLYVADASSEFRAYADQLVRFEVFASGHIIDASVSEAEAETFWLSNRPSLTVPIPDLESRAVVDLAAIDVATASQRADARRRYGAKAVALASLYDNLPTPQQLHGFVVPFAWYDRFMAENQIIVDGRVQSYRQLLEGWLRDEEFRSDQALRRQRLQYFVDVARREAALPAGFAATVSAHIVAGFGGGTTMVRLRSSSNAEDTPAFPGAGLYESRSACVDDGDAQVPSSCDANLATARSLRDGAVRVWTSLWDVGAFEEREYHQIDHRQVAMALLINQRVAGENATGVVVATPAGEDGVVTVEVAAQWGEVGVVRPELGVVAERTLLAVAGDGEVSVTRSSRSNLLPAGYVVLAREQLAELGRAVAGAVRETPIDGIDEADSQRLRIEMEWKFDGDGGLLIKQLRPLLAPVAPTPAGVLVSGSELATLCSGFIDDRNIWREQSLRSQVDLEPIAMLLPFEPSAYPIAADWPAAVRVWPQATALAAAGPGHFDLEVLSSLETDSYRFSYRREFAGGEVPASVEWEHIVRAPAGTAPVGEAVAIDADAAGLRLCMSDCAMPDQHAPMASCTMANLPAWRHHFAVGDPDFPWSEVDIRVRFAEQPIESGPLRIASVELKGASSELVDEFFALAYASKRHNQAEQFLIELGAAAAGAFLLVSEPDLGDDQQATLAIYDDNGLLQSSVVTDDFTRGPVTP